MTLNINKYFESQPKQNSTVFADAVYNSDELFKIPLSLLLNVSYHIRYNTRVYESSHKETCATGYSPEILSSKKSSVDAKINRTDNVVA